MEFLGIPRLLGIYFAGVKALTKEKETDDPKVPIYMYCILLKTTIFVERCGNVGY